MADPDRLPPGLAPLFLTLDQASAYAGVSPDTFVAEVAAGLWPPPVRRGVKGTKQTWHREALEAAARALAGNSPGRAAAAPPETPKPANAPVLTDADLELVERLSGKGQDRPQHRHPKAA